MCCWLIHYARRIIHPASCLPRLRLVEWDRDQLGSFVDKCIWMLRAAETIIASQNIMPSWHGNTLIILTLCKETPLGTGGFPLQGSLMGIFEVFFVVDQNELLSNLWSCRWFETFIRLCDVIMTFIPTILHYYHQDNSKERCLLVIYPYGCVSKQYVG